VRVTYVEPIAADALLDLLRRTRLRGFDGAQPYASATLRIEHGRDPASLAPAQGYVLAPAVRRILELHAALADWDVDLFALDGGLWIETDEAPGERIPVIPPIVERSSEPDGREVMVINDGMHRIQAARAAGAPITVVAAYDVPPEYPYYAFALPRGWADVVELDELPDGFQKKRYRIEGNYKALFRDFNAVLPGVQKERKKSNPEHLRA
jgi:hypothetical protein